MAATTGTYTINQGDATTASDLYTLFKNTICPGMGYDNSTELHHDVTNSRLVYTKTNQVGTYSTAYYEFYFVNNTVYYRLYHAYNTSTNTGTGTTTYNNGTWAVNGASYPMKLTYWKDSATDPQWGLLDVTRTDSDIPVSNSNYSAAMGWCKITPFSHLDPNAQITSLFISAQNTSYQDRYYWWSSGYQRTYGGYSTVGTTAYQTKYFNGSTIPFYIGHAGAGTNTGDNRSGRGFKISMSNLTSNSPIIVSPIIVGSHGMALGYINDTDLGVASPPSVDAYRVNDRLIVTAGSEEWQPTGRYSTELYVRVV
jgi:hypothetical protein